MELSKASEIANKYKTILSPFCERIEIAGSIRRKQPDVNDIEIVCIPKSEPCQDLFGKESRMVVNGFIKIINNLEKVKGEPTGKYTQRILPEGIKLDLFMPTVDNWGLIFAIRTGSAEYSHLVLATGWVKAGYKCIEGMLSKNGKQLAIREEIDLFNLIGLPYKKPEEREI